MRDNCEFSRASEQDAGRAEFTRANTTQAAQVKPCPSLRFVARTTPALPIKPSHSASCPAWLSIGGTVMGVSWSQTKKAISFAGSLLLAFADT